MSGPTAQGPVAGVGGDPLDGVRLAFGPQPREMLPGTQPLGT